MLHSGCENYYYICLRSTCRDCQLHSNAGRVMDETAQSLTRREAR
jgi:hypothetical protein